MAQLLDAPDSAASAPRLRTRVQAVGMVVLTLGMTLVMVWTGTGTSEAFLKRALERTTIQATRFVAKNAIRIGQTAQEAQMAMLNKAVNVGYKTALWGYDKWRELTDDEKVEGLPIPEPIKTELESPGAGFTPTRAGQWCTINLNSVNWTSSTASLVTTPTRHAFPPSFSDSNYNSGCVNGWRNYFKADLRCVKPGGAAYVRTGQTIAGMQGNYGNACAIVAQPDTVGASLQSVFVYPNPENMQYISALSPWELVNPEFNESVYNQRTITGRKKCVNEFDPLDVQMVERTGIGTEMMPLVPCPPGYYPEWVEYESQLGDNGQVRKMGRIELNPGQYPQCEMGQCTLKVTVDGETCVVGLEKCYDWLATEPASRVKCEYGPYSIGLDGCEALEFAYRTQSGMTIDPQEQLAPGRLVPAKPDGTTSPTIGPGTGWLPDPHPNPGGNPDPGGNPNPGGSTTGFPLRGSNPNPNPNGRPIKDAESFGNCLSSAWSWNPVDWVFTPVKCAITWAAVPKTEKVAAVRTRLGSSVDKSGAAGWFQAGQALVAIPSEGNSCGIPITFPLTNTEWRLLNACESPMGTVAGLCKAFLTVVIVTLGVLHGTRAVAGAFGYQFSMGGKGSADGD